MEDQERGDRRRTMPENEKGEQKERNCVGSPERWRTPKSEALSPRYGLKEPWRIALAKKERKDGVGEGHGLPVVRGVRRYEFEGPGGAGPFKPNDRSEESRVLALLGGGVEGRGKPIGQGTKAESDRSSTSKDTEDSRSFKVRGDKNSFKRAQKNLAGKQKDHTIAGGRWNARSTLI